MSNKSTNCTSCGAEIATSAMTCPQCGAKAKHPVTKKWWFWVLVIIVAATIIGGASSGEKSNTTPSTTQPSGTTTQPSDTEQSISYTHYNVTELFDALDTNAMKAQADFKGQYVEIEGYLSVIDSDGKYIGVGAAPNDYTYALQNVHCSIKNNEQKQQIMGINSGSSITVRGKITSVGEIMGFSMNIDSIN